MKNYYHLERQKGRAHSGIKKVIWTKGRDKSRTPMQLANAPMSRFTRDNSTLWD